MSVKTTNYILLVVCSFRSNTKRECVLEIGLVCCFIPIHISQVGVMVAYQSPCLEIKFRLLYLQPVEYIAKLINLQCRGSDISHPRHI